MNPQPIDAGNGSGPDTPSAATLLAQAAAAWLDEDPARLDGIVSGDMAGIYDSWVALSDLALSREATRRVLAVGPKARPE